MSAPVTHQDQGFGRNWLTWPLTHFAFQKQRGKGAVRSTFSYKPTPSGGETVTVTDLATNAVTESELDALGRTIREETRDSSGTVLSRILHAFDASGRLVYSARKQGEAIIEESSQYDPSGRLIEQSLNNAAVNGSRETLATRSTFQLTGNGMVETSIGPFATGQDACGAQKCSRDQFTPQTVDSEPESWFPRRG